MKKLLIAFIAALALSARSAFAADLAPVPYYKAPPQAPPVWSWTGFYVGIDGGYGWNTNTGGELCYDPAGVLFGGICAVGYATGPVVRPSGGLFGGEAGYNWQTGVIVAGIETDMQWSGIRGTSAPVLIGSGPSGTYTATDNMTWFGTTRGRIGFLANPDLLMYATGGVIYAGESVSSLSAPLPGFIGTYPASTSTTRTGGVAGAGIEYRFNGNLSAKLEELYYDMGSIQNVFTCPASGITPTGVVCLTGFGLGGQYKFEGVIIRGGLNWHFNMGGPIYAKE
jgi:outer membrane immunogenic protein